MDVPVLVEPVANGFRATGGAPFDLSAEGSTSSEALDRLREMMSQRVASGARVVYVSVPGEHPGAPLAGDLKGDPMLDEWVEAMAEYRRERGRDMAF
ncbi:MAG TPA: hypothetical protein VFJ58_28600 [Armatimonadota bacterium]|nr:hypothetical protein [Armatimonadota bacterium]